MRGESGRIGGLLAGEMYGYDAGRVTLHREQKQDFDERRREHLAQKTRSSDAVAFRGSLCSARGQRFLLGKVCQGGTAMSIRPRSHAESSAAEGTDGQSRQCSPRP